MMMNIMKSTQELWHFN